MGQFLQRYLRSLTLQDPYSVADSSGVVETLRNGLPGANGAFSVDIDGLFYSILYDELFLVLRELIDQNGPVSFQNACGFSVDAFLELLTMYLSSTAVEFNRSLFLQKKRNVYWGVRSTDSLPDIFSQV